MIPLPHGGVPAGPLEARLFAGRELPLTCAPSGATPFLPCHQVTGRGTLDAKTIDEQQLIDTHYGAIASKAVKLQPSELNVSDKAQAEFKAAFGLDWADAVAQGKVYNAVDGCKKMGCKPNEMESKYWCKLKKGKNLIKFGGGFYCGQLKDDVFVINGFYMSMRSVFTTPPAQLEW